MSDEPRLSNRMRDLACAVSQAIKNSDEAAEKAAQHALDAGNLLCEAKEECPHGSWLPFLGQAGINDRRAQRSRGSGRRPENPALHRARRANHFGEVQGEALVRKTKKRASRRRLLNEASYLRKMDTPPASLMPAEEPEPQESERQEEQPTKATGRA